MKTRRSFLKAAAASLAAAFALPFTLPAWLNPFKEEGLPSLHVKPGETVTLTEGAVFEKLRIEKDGRLILDFDDPDDCFTCSDYTIHVDGRLIIKRHEGDPVPFKLADGWPDAVNLAIEDYAPYIPPVDVSPGHFSEVQLGESLEISNWPSHL